MTLKEELNLCATLDSLAYAGIDLENLKAFAMKVGLKSWADFWTI